MQAKKSANIANVKTALVVAAGIINLLFEWPPQGLGIPLVAYPILFAFPILTISLAASTWLHFQKPTWTEQPFLNPNRLAMAQFGAVFMGAIAVSAAAGALFRGGVIPDISYAAACVSVGYFASISLGLRLKAKREADEAR